MREGWIARPDPSGGARWTRVTGPASQRFQSRDGMVCAVGDGGSVSQRREMQASIGLVVEGSN